MDLRIVKTRKMIRESFILLREKQETEKIKVVDLCALALINKTTFYKYYQDIYALSDEMDKEFFDRFWDDFEAKDLLFEDTEKFITGLPKAFDKNGKVLTALFSDRFEIFFSMVENELLKYYVKPEMSEREQIRINFAIRGLVQILKTIKVERNWTISEAAEYVTDIFSLI